MVFKHRFLSFILLWVFVSVWQLLLMVFMLRSFVSSMFPGGFVSYVLSAGYIVCHITGHHRWGPMPLTDWQWGAGMVVMLFLSVLATFPHDRKCRLSAGLLFVALHIAGSFCTFLNMASAIT